VPAYDKPFVRAARGAAHIGGRHDVKPGLMKRAEANALHGEKPLECGGSTPLLTGRLDGTPLLIAASSRGAKSGAELPHSKTGDQKLPFTPKTQLAPYSSIERR